MAKTVYIKKARTGGAANALDGINGNNLTADDVAIVFHDSVGEIFELSTDASTEIAPNVYTPDSNPGSFAWKNQSQWLAVSTSGGISIPAYGHTIITSTKAGVYTLGTPFAGARKRVTSYSTFAHKIKTGADGIKISSTHTVVTLTCSSAGLGGKFGVGFDLIGKSTTLWYLQPGSTRGIAAFATAT